MTSSLKPTKILNWLSYLLLQAVHVPKESFSASLAGIILSRNLCIRRFASGVTKVVLDVQNYCCDRSLRVRLTRIQRIETIASRVVVQHFSCSFVHSFGSLIVHALVDVLGGC